MLRPWFFLHEGGEAIEIVGPEAFITIEPGKRVAHRMSGQPAGDDAAGLFARHEPGIREHIEMLHDRGQRHRKGLRQFADRERIARGELRQHRTPRRVGERRKGAIQRVGFGSIETLNHMV
jgi:hypothetical protein